MSDENNKTDLSRLERLAALLRDDGANIDAMNVEQLSQYLKANKVDMAGPEKRVANILKKAKAQRRLELARQRRLEAVERAKNLLSAGNDAVAAVREHVRSMIESFKRHDPEQAQVYAREFEKATPEDLVVLEEDLTLLEMDEPADGESDQQDAR